MKHSKWRSNKMFYMILKVNLKRKGILWSLNVSISSNIYGLLLISSGGLTCLKDPSESMCCWVICLQAPISLILYWQKTKFSWPKRSNCIYANSVLFWITSFQFNWWFVEEWVSRKYSIKQIFKTTAISNFLQLQRQWDHCLITSTITILTSDWLSLATMHQLNFKTL